MKRVLDRIAEGVGRLIWLAEGPTWTTFLVLAALDKVFAHHPVARGAALVVCVPMMLVGWVTTWLAVTSVGR